MILRHVDRAVRRYGTLAVFFLFTLGVALVWSGGGGMHAQTPGEDALRITEIENRTKEQTAAMQSATLLLAEHDRRMAVQETKLENVVKSQDEMHGYIKWLVLGVFGLLGMAAWEKVIGPARAGSGGEVPLYGARRK